MSRAPRLPNGLALARGEMSRDRNPTRSGCLPSFSWSTHGSREFKTAPRSDQTHDHRALQNLDRTLKFGALNPRGFLRHAVRRYCLCELNLPPAAAPGGGTQKRSASPPGSAGGKGIHKHALAKYYVFREIS